MSECYYQPCRELDICNELIEKYFNTQQYEKCFEGHLALQSRGIRLRSVRWDISIMTVWAWKRTYPRLCGGHAGQLIMATEMDNATLPGFTKMVSVWSETWNRRHFGIDMPPCRIMILPL